MKTPRFWLALMAAAMAMAMAALLAFEINQSKALQESKNQIRKLNLAYFVFLAP